MIEDKNIGSSLEDFLQEEGRLEEARQVAAKRVLSWQLQEAMKSLHLNKAEMAKRMHTSRSQLDRLLDPDNDKVQLDTLNRAAAIVGKRLKIELVEAKSGGLETAVGRTGMPVRREPGGLGVRHQRRDISGTMHDTDNLDAAGDLAIQDEIPPYRKVTEFSRNVGTHRAKAGMIRKKRELLLDFIKKAVGGPHIVMGDGEPDVDQVFLGLRRSPDGWHGPSRARFLGFLRLDKPPPGLGLDRCHIGKLSRTARQPLFPETPQLLDLFSLQSAPPLPLPERFAHDLAAGSIFPALDGFTNSRQHLRRQRNTHFLDIRHDTVLLTP